MRQRLAGALVMIASLACAGQAWSAELSINDFTMAESDGGHTVFTFTVTIDEEARSVSVNFTTADGTAVAGEDYGATSGQLTFDLGEKEKYITVTIFGDINCESDETFAVNLSGPVNATITDGVGEGTIRNDDDVPIINVDDAAALEGASNEYPEIAFPVSLSMITCQNVTVYCHETAGTATPDMDYHTVVNPVVIPAGQIGGFAYVELYGDNYYEGDETFYLTLGSPVNGTLGDAEAIGTILDDDPYPIVDIHDAGVLEGDDWPENEMYLPVTLSWPYYGGDVTLFCSVYMGTAGVGDYFDLPCSVVIPHGETLGFVSIEIIGESFLEDDETILAELSSVVNGILGNISATGLIINDDFITCGPLPGPVSDLHLDKSMDGSELLLTWAEAADADDYIIHRDFTPSGSFADVPGVALDGASEIILQMPLFDSYFLVGGRNSCGFGPFD